MPSLRQLVKRGTALWVEGRPTGDAEKPSVKHGTWGDFAYATRAGGIQVASEHRREDSGCLIDSLSKKLSNCRTRPTAVTLKQRLPASRDENSQTPRTRHRAAFGPTLK